MADQQKIIQYVAQSLQNGVDPNQILAELKQQGIPEEQGKQLIQQIAQQMQQAEGQATQGGGEGAGVTAEQAIEAFKQSGLPPAAIVRTIQILLEMSPEEIQKLLTMLEQGGQQQQQPEQEPEPGQENY